MLARRLVARASGAPWAAVAVGAFPIFGLALAPAGAALAVAGFGACALTLRRAVAKAVAGRYVRTTHASAHLSRQAAWTYLAGPSTC